MNPSVIQRALLLAHPDASGQAVWRVDVEVELAGGTSLTCRYSLHGDLARVRVPGTRAGLRSDGLWKHTCCEAFIGSAAEAGYYEFNFSPALDWAAYRFEDYRAGMTAATLSQTPELHVRSTPRELELSATVRLAGLEPLCSAPALRVALAVVIEEQDGGHAYWALQHAAGHPDFHHPDSFTLELRSS
jgi:hypothetical protein